VAEAKTKGERGLAGTVQTFVILLRRKGKGGGGLLSVSSSRGLSSSSGFLGEKGLWVKSRRKKEGGGRGWAGSEEKKKRKVLISNKLKGGMQDTHSKFNRMGGITEKLLVSLRKGGGLSRR